MSAVMLAEPNRTFNFAVLASIVLHAALLFGFTLRERVRPAEPPAPLVARLVERPAAVPAMTPAASPQEPVKPRARSKPVPKPLAKEAPAPEVEPLAQSAPEAPQMAEAQQVAPNPELPAPAVIARVESGPAAPASPSMAESAPDPGWLAKYRQQVILAAPQYKRYPRVANDNNWAGTVSLRMVIGANGSIAAVRVTKTSGYDVLDQQAQEMFRKAAQSVPVPPVLRGKEFGFEVGAIYEFKE